MGIMNKVASPNISLAMAVAFLTQIFPFGNTVFAFPSWQPISPPLASVSPSYQGKRPVEARGLFLARSEGWGSLNEEDSDNGKMPLGTGQKGSEEPIRDRQGKWEPIGGQVPSAGVRAGSAPAVFQKDRLTIVFTPGSRAAERLQVTRVTSLPPIQGTTEELRAYRGLQLVSDAWEIRDPTGAAEPFEIELRFDPAVARGKDLILLAVSDGRVWTPRVFAAGPGYVIAEGEHFSWWFVVASSILLVTLVGVAWQANSFTSNEAAPWTLIEPGHQKIKGFIQQNKLSLPTLSPGTKRANLTNYKNKKVFEERKDTYGNRVVHLIGKRGSAVLDETKVACWDLTTLFASILYTLDPDIGPRMRLVKGTAGEIRHSWIEVVIDGQVFVVNTGAQGLTDFEFVARDVLYKEQNLKPKQSYTKDADSLRDYNPDWFKPYLGADPSGLTSVTVSVSPTKLTVWDHGTEDLDKVSISLNGKVVNANVTLRKSKQVLTLYLVQGTNTLSIKALDEGDPAINKRLNLPRGNAAAVEIEGVTVGKRSQSWVLMKGQTGTMQITYQPK